MVDSLFRSFQQKRYLFLLGILLILLVVQPIASSLGFAEFLFDGLFVIVMTVLVLGLAKSRAWQILGCLICVPAAILVILDYSFLSDDNHTSLLAGHAIGAVFFVLVAGRIISSLFSPPDLSWDSVFGAICGYLLLGISWALTYQVLYIADPDSFQFSQEVRPDLVLAGDRRSIFIYYSFVTLTTVGYGDVIPLSTTARTLAWVEALTGQLYLAVLIAGLISALVARNVASRRQG